MSSNHTLPTDDLSTYGTKLTPTGSTIHLLFDLAAAQLQALGKTRQVSPSATRNTRSAAVDDRDSNMFLSCILSCLAACCLTLIDRFSIFRPNERIQVSC